MQDSSSKMMQYLAGDLLDFSQMNKGVFSKDECVFNLKNSIKEVVQMLDHRAQSNKINVKCVFIPFSDNSFDINTDSHRL